MKYTVLVTWLDNRKESYPCSAYSVHDGCLWLISPQYEGPLLIPLRSVRTVIVDGDKR